MALASCSLPEEVARRPSPEVTYEGDHLLHRGKRFTGVLEERFETADVVRRTHYRRGLRDGVEEETFLASGKLAARRQYAGGKKVGAHEGWFDNGKRRFLYDYKDGQYDGEAWEWYPTGALAMFARFDRGQVLGKKMWRESGQIYMNYVFPGEKAVGTPGVKLCYQVRAQ